MTCMGCVAKIRSALQQVPNVISVEIDKSSGKATIEAKEMIPLSHFQKIIKHLDQKYAISQESIQEVHKESRSWFQAYKPILLVFFYIFLVTLIVQVKNNVFDIREWMSHFMAGFFIVFSFFKFLDLPGFATSYMGYDIIAKRWRGWGYVYAFIELGLGLSYLLDCCPLVTNIAAFVVMSISITGVLQSVVNKREIQCACLGAVFDLPMSTVTIIEDAVMIVMSGFMILQLVS